uniref:Dead end protein 1-like n=1 Tax=Echeneis naucrates TaxID=173247 RepID=A0A665VC41_ECHNA
MKGMMNVLDLERVHALKTWLKENNIKLTQINGQRKYGGPPEGWDGPMPGANCEVFISHIPRDVYEDLLIPLFSSVGPLWEFRLMMNFSGQNRGFAYAKYSSSSVADTAICLLHGYPLAPGVRLSVCHSTEKRHLCIDGLPATTRQGDLFQVLQLLVEGVERVSLMKGPGTGGVSAMVAFLSHHTASMAKKVLVEGSRSYFLCCFFSTDSSFLVPAPIPLVTASCFCAQHSRSIFCWTSGFSGSQLKRGRVRTRRCFQETLQGALVARSRRATSPTLHSCQSRPLPRPAVRGPPLVSAEQWADQLAPVVSPSLVPHLLSSPFAEAFRVCSIPGNADLLSVDQCDAEENNSDDYERSSVDFVVFRRFILEVHHRLWKLKMFICTC